MVDLDVEYIDNPSLWTDFKLIIQTPFAVIKGKGAA
jgi:lipopolysaccharide/colanic/teichoic acid biosynthesis glycosyltransferase